MGKDTMDMTNENTCIDRHREETPRKRGWSGYDQVARGPNRPMYDYYAEKIREKTGIVRGACLDVGANGGYLGLALARITGLSFTFLDISAEALETAGKNIMEDGLESRASTLHGDVHHIPLPDASFQLVISRGSIPFWEDLTAGLREIYRVLAPGGEACVVCGRGTPEMQAAMAARRGGREGCGPQDRPKRDYASILKETGIGRASYSRGDDGMWIWLWK